MSKVKMVIPKQNSPIGAIRKYCTECSGGGRKEISDCHIYRCPLFPYRFGVMPDTYAANNDVEIINTEGVKKDDKTQKKRSRKTDSQ